jgi:competence protein ComFB
VIALKNYMETVVEELLALCLKKGEPLCDCARCRLDVVAHALNHLPSKYVVTPEGEKYAQMESLNLQSKTEVMARVLDSIQVVSKNPRH